MAGPFDHSEMTLANVHPPHRWEFADATARGALVAAPTDLYSVGLQLSDFSYWILIDDSPLTWQAVSAAAAVSSVNSQTGAVVLDADDIDDTSTTNKFATAAELTKLGGIEALADVTDATNVDAAGATMNADASLAGNSYFLDEDTMSSDSSTKVPSQQSVKAYVDSAIAGVGAGTIAVQEGDSTVSAAASTLDFDATDFNITESPAGEANVALNYGTGAGQPAEGNHGHTITGGFSVNLGDGTNVITSTEPPVYLRLPVGVTWTRWDIQSDVSGSLVVEVARATNAAPNTFSSIAGTKKPTLSGAQDASETDLTTGWGDDDTDAGDRIRFTVSGTPASVRRVAVHVTTTYVL